jgi:hypothetical protein
MDTLWKDRWDERYRNPEFAYGQHPNNYLKEQLDKVVPRAIVFPAEGEGRNAVYAAKRGWKVSAFDISVEGKKKAELLATMNNVTIDYHVGEIETLNYRPEQFQALALIYAHFPADVKGLYHQTLEKYLAPGGIIIFEAFSKRHLDYIAKNEKVGGPKELEMLFSIEELLADFPNYDVIELVEQEVELNEGHFHNGKGSVIRFVGRKK